jgi:Fe2+ transport system protein FeoA
VSGGFRLDQAAPSVRVRVLDVAGDQAIRRRLQAQGIRPGVSLGVVRATAGGGVIVAVGGARVALGRAAVVSVTVGEPDE